MKFDLTCRYGRYKIQDISPKKQKKIITKKKRRKLLTERACVHPSVKPKTITLKKKENCK